MESGWFIESSTLKNDLKHALEVSYIYIYIYIYIYKWMNEKNMY